ncbi:MAG TPA: hypothetical protein VNM15_01540 [Candidatus Binatia bacterium]|nr:hypothetical protein [Candidatus Binatia bacterium]
MPFKPGGVKLFTMSSGETVTAAPQIQSGWCYVNFAYDAARSINLEAADRRIHETTKRPTIAHRRRTPSYFEYQPPPLHLSQDGETLRIGSFATRPGVDLMIYDFGAIAVAYTLPIAGPFEDLLRLSEELYDNETLLADSRLRIDQILKVIGDAATQPHPSPFIEDYVIFHIQSFEQPADPRQLCFDHARAIAQVLRAERQALSDQEVEDALAMRVSYSAEDVTIVDWNAALLLDREGEDIRAVLEFANVELLEMRYVDQKLDRALDQAYETLTRHSWGLARIFKSYGADLRSLAELQVDNAALFEGVNNTLKLLGDQFLARVYRMVNRRFHLDEWDESILRKLETLESIYEKISDQASTRRMEVLEWVIIFLIAFSIALEFIR